MATYVLVPGAWFGDWVWDDVTAQLRARGHDVYPLTLTGLGERAHLGGPQVDLDTNIEDVAATITHRELTDVILVGHSYAGIVVTGVAERVADRLAQLVFVDTGPMPDGAATVDFYDPDARAALVQQVESEGDGWRYELPPLDVLAQDASLAGLDERARALMQRRATPQPFATYTQPVRRSQPWGGLAWTIITCTDGGLTAAQWQEMAAAGVPMLAELAEPGWEFVELATGHWPMLSAPAELAVILDRLAA